MLEVLGKLLTLILSNFIVQPVQVRIALFSWLPCKAQKRWISSNSVHFSLIISMCIIYKRCVLWERLVDCIGVGNECDHPIVCIALRRKHMILSPLNKHADSKHLYTPHEQTHIISMVGLLNCKLRIYMHTSTSFCIT